MTRNRLTALALACALQNAWAAEPATTPANDDYGHAVAQKLASGFSNLGLGIAEIPKNVIITTNQTNVLFGATGGVLKGVLHTAGRTLSGVVDVISFPIPTQPITRPALVWQNFGTETQYGPLFSRR